MMINVIELKRKVIDAFLISQTRFVSTSFNKISKIYTGESTNADEKIKYSIKTDSCYPYISTKDISMNGLVDYENGMYIPKKITKFSIAPANSVLMCIEGGNAGNKIAIINQPICFVNKLCCFDTTGADNRFIYYYLLSNQFRSNFKGQMTGLIGGVSVKKIKELLLPLPDISEQKRIADKLDEIFAELDKIDAMQNRLKIIQEKMESKILKLAIQGKLVEQRPEEGTGEELFKLIQQEKQLLIKEGKIKKEKPLQPIEKSEIPFEIPSTWKWVKIGDVVNKNLGGGTPSKSEPLFWMNGTIPWITVKDFPSAEEGYLVDTIDHITELGLEKSATNLVDENSFVICVRMALGKILRVTRPMAINQDLRAIWLNTNINQNYFYRFYSTLKIEGRGITVSGIKKDELMSLLFPLPPLKEQKRIVAKIEKLISLCKAV